MTLPQLVQAAVEANAAEHFGPFATLCCFLSYAAGVAFFTRFMRGSPFRLVCAFAAWLLVCFGIGCGVDRLAEGFKRDTAPLVQVVRSAVEFPRLATLTYRTATDALEVTAGGVEAFPAADPLSHPLYRMTWTPRTVVLPMRLVHGLDQALSGQPRSLRFLPPDPSPLDLRLRPALEHWYILPVRRFFWGALAAAAVFCVFAVGQAGGNRSLPFIAGFCLFLVTHHLYCRKLDAEYGSAAACEPIAAALAKAYADPAAVTFVEQRGPGPDGRRLTVLAAVPRTFLGHTGYMQVVATLPAPLLRQLDAAAASLGFAPLNSKPAN